MVWRISHGYHGTAPTRRLPFRQESFHCAPYIVPDAKPLCCTSVSLIRQEHFPIAENHVIEKELLNSGELMHAGIENPGQAF
jgi:hypothetical protein